MKRRSFLVTALAAPFVVRSGVLMPVRQVIVPPVNLRAAARAAWVDWHQLMHDELMIAYYSGTQFDPDQFRALYSSKHPPLSLNRILS